MGRAIGSQRRQALPPDAPRRPPGPRSPEAGSKGQADSGTQSRERRQQPQASKSAPVACLSAPSCWQGLPGAGALRRPMGLELPGRRAEQGVPKRW